MGYAFVVLEHYITPMKMMNPLSDINPGRAIWAGSLVMGTVAVYPVQDDRMYRGSWNTLSEEEKDFTW